MRTDSRRPSPPIRLSSAFSPTKKGGDSALLGASGYPGNERPERVCFPCGISVDRQTVEFLFEAGSRGIEIAIVKTGRLAIRPVDRVTAADAAFIEANLKDLYAAVLCLGSNDLEAIQ